MTLALFRRRRPAPTGGQHAIMPGPPPSVPRLLPPPVAPEHAWPPRPTAVTRPTCCPHDLTVFWHTCRAWDPPFQPGPPTSP